MLQLSFHINAAVGWFSVTFILPVLFFCFFTAERQKQRVVKRVPKGTSDYQAAWIVDSDDDGEAAEVGGLL